MFSCVEVRDLLGDHAEGTLPEEVQCRVEDHLKSCEECGELRRTLDLIAQVIPDLGLLEPPPYLEGDLSASACRRWLGLLFQAVDREISQHNLERLLSHLESCESCTRTWNDLTLMHQAGQAMEPPQGFVQRCIGVRDRIFQRPIISRRAVTAAAYLMAVLASLLIGNPVSIARSPVVQRVTETVTTEVNQAAEQGRGEIKVMLWRAWQWTGRSIDAIENFVRSDRSETDHPESHSAVEQGDSQ
jgi:hypothetical protein